MHVPKEMRKKWDVKSEEPLFVGYCDDSKGYRFIRQETNKLVKSRDVFFVENQTCVNKFRNETVPIVFEVNSEEVRESIFPEVNENENCFGERDAESFHSSESSTDPEANVSIKIAPSTVSAEIPTEVLVNVQPTLRKTNRAIKKCEDFISYLAKVKDNNCNDPLTV